tara:strand:+ start:2480 stop:4315 length:1836 start_codon:yes stop_codon:yes gene_type:complete
MKNKKIDLKRIYEFMKPEWFFMVISLLCGLFFVLFNSISIWLTASLINNVLMDFDSLLLEQSTLINQEITTVNQKLKIIVNNLILRESYLETLQVLCYTIITIFIFKNIFLYLKNLSMSYVQLRIVTQFRNSLYAHLQKMSLAFFYRKRSGDLSSIIMHDVGALNQSIGVAFQKIIVEPINIFTIAILLFIISWKLMLIAILIIPFSQFIMQTIGRSIRRKARRNTKQIGGILSIITETLSSIRIVKAFAMGEKEKERFNIESWKYFNLQFRSSKLRLMSSPIIESIGVSMAVLLLWLGGSSVIKGASLSSEDFLRFMFLLFSMLGPIRSLSNVHIVLQNGFASAERIFTILDEKPEIVDSGIKKIQTLETNLKFENVSFAYDSGSFRLTDINFEIPKGNTVALVGSSGSGKSTIADLIPRFFDISKGIISIDGIDIKDFSIASLSGIMGIVTQETILLNTSIRENIIYGNEIVDDHKLLDSITAANAIDFINDLEDGLDTVIGERGVKLSGGQKQRVAIARALFKNPKLLILDEATSALDSESERLVQEALETLMEDRTVLVIAHRLSTVTNADKIIVLDNGKIIEQGTHKDLIQLNKHYKFLYDNQFRD